MANFVLKEGTNLKFSSEQIGYVKAYFDQKGLKDFSFTESEQLEFAKLVFRLTNDGEPLSYVDGENMARLFKGDPGMLYASKENVDELVRRITIQLASSVYPGYELGLRFHLGKTTSNDKTYQAVVVPVCGPVPSAGSLRDHYAEQENRLFARAHVDWFGLCLDDWYSGAAGKIVNLEEAKARIAVSDSGEGNTIVYFSYAAFKKFLANLQRPYKWIAIKFCRISPSNSRLSVLFMFIGEDRNPVTYRGGYFEAESMYFDRGDLIPPPYPDDDDSDIDPKP